MNKEYQLDKEYTILEIIRYNLRKWWLALICAAVCAVALGGYKFISLYPYLEKDAYENIHQVTSTLYVQQYSDEGSVERVNNIVRMAGSYRAYELVKEKTGCDMEYQSYQLVFDIMQGEAGDVATIYLTYPVTIGNFSIADEDAALAFTNAIIEATDELAQDLIGEKCFQVLDAPYLSSEVKEVESYSITKEDFQKGVLKAVTAGVLLGIIVEVVLYTFWLILCRKPKSVEEVRECLEVPVIDDLKSKDANEEEVFKKVALFLNEDSKTAGADGKRCISINCMPAQCPKKDVALKLAMSYANEQKKTLYIDLSADKEGRDAEHSISRYVLGEADMPKPNSLNAYLDTVCRNAAEEKGFNIVMNERFADYLAKKSDEYAYIIVNSPDVTENADAYAAAKLCDKTFVVCARKRVDNETLYRMKNTAGVNGISIEGVLVYEL